MQQVVSVSFERQHRDREAHLAFRLRDTNAEHIRVNRQIDIVLAHARYVGLDVKFVCNSK